MNRIEIAIRSFFWIFFNKRFADKVGAFFTDKVEETEIELKKTPKLQQEDHNDAVQLIAAFQRDGRLVDFLMEPIDSYSDGQIGAAVRDIHRDCKSVLNRVFSPLPINENDEGIEISVPKGFDPLQYRLSGNVSGTPPYNGIIRHKGWRATKVDLPKWQGGTVSMQVIAPVEVELP